MAGVRDYAYIALAVGLVFGSLALVTGNWPPVVAVQSNSMMHVNESEYVSGEGDTRAEDVGFGRLGTIDPGDIVVVDSVDDIRDIDTYAEGGEENYGRPGDAVVFDHTGTGTDLTVVHRAMTYVSTQGEGENRTYTVQWTDEWSPPSEDLATCTREPTYTCTFDERGVFLPELGVFRCPDTAPPQTGGLGQPECQNPRPKPFLGPGLITKGDNNVTNPGADQAPVGRGEQALNPQPVAPQQIHGVARGEVPALGLLKVAFSGNELHNADIRGHDYYFRIGNMVAPADLWALAAIEVVVISASPVAVTIGRQLWEGRDEERVREFSSLREAIGRGRS